ncbi:MAG: hypothetical protein IMF16_07875 [Proteobacteria bacterium]|nr:hypothetical protein [Pseudomonadota bacterium]
MSALNAGITRVFDLVFLPSGVSPWLGMIIVSMVTGLVLLLVFRYTSNQQGIRAAKDRIMAHLLEVLLYRDELPVVLRAQVYLLGANLRYLGYALVPLLFMIVPVGLLLVQTDLRYGYRPLQVGESAIVAAQIRSEGGALEGVSISAPPGLEVETAALRMPDVGEVNWRVRAVSPGTHELRIRVGGEEFVKQVVVGEGATRVAVQRVGGPAWRQFLYPGESPLPGGGPVEEIHVFYPSASLRFFGWRLHWVWPWLIVSMVFGYALKGPLRVQV